MRRQGLINGWPPGGLKALLILVVCSGFVPVALADDPAMVTAAGQLIRTLLGLAVVLLLLFALAWAARRWSLPGLVARSNGDEADALKVVAQVSLGMKERLVLVEVDGKRVLLGVVPGRISRLAEPADPQAFERALAVAREEKS